MLEYSDYDFYENTYGGSLDISLFNSLIPKASQEIDNVVNRELKEADITNKVKFVACQMVDFLKVYGPQKDGQLISKSMDGVSKTFQSKSKLEIDKERARILNGLPLDLISFL